MFTKKPKTEHQRMVYELCSNTGLLESVLNHSVYIRSTEFLIDKETKEKADIVFQNHPIPYWHENLICYVAEIKSDQGDHELLGQIEKSVDALEKRRFYSEVRGIAIAKEFTKSGLNLLNNHGYLGFRWAETKKGVYLEDMGNKLLPKHTTKRPVIGTPHWSQVSREVILYTNFCGK
jgi:hypothetical protein